MIHNKIVDISTKVNLIRKTGKDGAIERVTEVCMT